MSGARVALFLLAIVAGTQAWDLADYFASLFAPGDEEPYLDQVIYIESLRYRGTWLGATTPGWLPTLFAPSLERDVVSNVALKWHVTAADSPYTRAVVFESEAFPGCFLDAHDSGYARVNCDPYPYNKNWALWYMERPSDNPDAIEIRSYRFSDHRVDAHEDHWAKITAGTGTWSEMRIYQPDFSEELVLIYTIDNSDGNTDIVRTVSESVGIAHTESVEVEITAQLGVEIADVFSSQLSVTWKTTSSSTWSEETTVTTEYTVKPGFVKRIYQLQGSYGPYKIHSSDITVTDFEMR